MASKPPKTANGRTTAPQTTAASAAPQEAASLAFAQEQLLNLIAMTEVMFKGAEEMRRCQMEAAQEARRQYERAQANVASAANPTELLNVQGELMRYDMEAAGQYWQKLAAICATTQAEAVNLMTRGAALAGGGMTRLMAQPAGTTQPRPATPAAAGDGAAAVDPSQAWNRWMDLGKQWTDMLYRSEAALH
ncbi:MAG: phasin family protein [Rhizobacter sp.]|nr:phasin family protein [Rhizobacter sp.]